MAELIGFKKTKTAVFISGAGSNLKSLIKFSKLKKSPISINLIISDNRKAKGLKFGKTFNIKKKIFEFKKDKPLIEKTYPIESFKEAHQHAEQSGKKGSVVMVMQDYME